MKPSAKSMVLACMLALGTSAASAETLRVGMQDDPDALDPAIGGTYAGRIVFDAMCDKLVDINETLEIVPQLATSWKWNDDNTELTMSLRDGVTFQDGTPFNAEAVKANIERMKTIDESRRKSQLAPITDVEIVDDHTIVLKLDAPFAPLLSILTDRAGMMVSPAVAGSADAFAANPVCSGPYKLVDRKARDSITLEKYDGYWNAGEIGYDTIVYEIIPDSTVRLSRLQAGDLEAAERIAPTDLATVRSDDGLALHTSPGLAVSHLFISQKAGAGVLADNADLRHALELSIDRNIINQVAFNGEFTADNQMIPPSSAFYSTSHPMPARDLDAARELIAKSGVENPTIEITYENSLTDGRVAQIIQSMAGEAGFTVNLLPLETSSAIDRYLAGNFELYIGNWSGRADPDPTLYTFFGSDGSQNLNGYSNPKLDEVLIAARKELDMDARKKLYDEAADIYLADLPTVPLYHPTWFYAAQANIDGIKIYPDGILRVTGLKPAGE
ncbi:peptide/nickel transport system substrate-binding protein [Rhodobium orientis]|uniref:ABC transporter substrate-binding protein n=1 Tax=Rhodobium orientis TaxID=34017 RepID=A0A327JPB5_9HYPH|nr:ABC transporter substrate-binding protein [Rhodobium orientis]MBB4303545.1 peptide/nickel transport system substrate-binding protein [Rhodobium orientis]MBK5950474.1 ABC transporter substrate-binding protein [Rhodobium orientis]RAI28310.1 ABC transporter substrate-binding protein [Rhodobium orientis]